MSTSDFGFQPHYTGSPGTLNRGAGSKGDQHLYRGMERQQRDWEREFDRLKNDFFKTKFDDTFDSLSSPHTLHRQVFRTPSLTPSPNPSPPREIHYVRPTMIRPDVRMEGPFRSGSAPPGSAHIQVGGIPVEQRAYRVAFDLARFDPEDVRVTLSGNEMQVNARREEEVGGGNKNVQEYCETVFLPKHVDPDRLISRFCDGRLVIEQPLPPSYHEALMILRELRASQS